MDGFVNVDIDPSVRPDVVCDLAALPFRPESFGFIRCCHVLEHLNEDSWQQKFDMSKALLEFSRVLTDNGSCKVEVPSPQGQDAVRIQHYTVFGHKRLCHIFGRYFSSVACRGASSTWVEARFLHWIFDKLSRRDPFWANAYEFTLQGTLRRTDIVRT